MRRCGFTLVELLAANLLAALLMIVLLAVIAMLARDTRAQAVTETRRRGDEQTAGIVRVLQWDLANADRWRMDRGTLVLEGHGSLDATSVEPSDLPVVVEYGTVERGGKWWLTRSERPRASKSGARRTFARNELVCPGVTAINVHSTGSQTSSQWQSTPSRARLQLAWNQPDRTNLDEVIVIR